MIDPNELHALADGELSAADSKRVRQLVSSDPSAELELSAIYNLKDCVREKAQIFTCEITYAASMKRVAELDRSRKVESFVGRYAWGISGGFLLLIVFAGVMNRTVNANRVQSSDLASTMANFPTPGHHAAPSSYDRWIDALLAQSDPGRLRLVGTSLVDLDGREVMRVELRDGDGFLSLLLIPGHVNFEGMDTAAAGSMLTGKINGMNCVAMNVGERSMVLVADRPYDRLAEVASHFVIR